MSVPKTAYAGRHIKYDSDQKVYNFIVNFKTENDGIAPTMREIADNVGISSTSVVNTILERLQDKGFIVLIDEVARGIKVVGGKWTIGEE